jgi:hypothetical protein
MVRWLLQYHGLTPSTGGLQVTVCLVRALNLPLRDAKTVNAWVGLGGSWTDEQIERELWPRVVELMPTWLDTTPR